MTKLYFIKWTYIGTDESMLFTKDQYKTYRYIYVDKFGTDKIFDCLSLSTFGS